MKVVHMVKIPDCRNLNSLYDFGPDPWSALSKSQFVSSLVPDLQNRNDNGSFVC